MRLIVSLFLILLWLIPAQAQISKGQAIISTGPGGRPCGPIHLETWQNNTGAPINIVQIQIWNGLGEGTKSDVTQVVIRQSDGAILIDGGHDDYTNGAGNQRIQKENWGGGTYMILPAGDTLRFVFGCTNPAAGIGGWIVTIWFK